MLIEDVRGAKSKVLSCRIAGSVTVVGAEQSKAERWCVRETLPAKMRLESETRPVVVGLWNGGATHKLLLHLAGPDRPGLG